jgi:hypothetical protein
MLNDPFFQEASITKKDPRNPSPLEKKDEILFNSIWRLLRLRGYVDAEHKPTKWGKVLYAILSNIPSDEYEEAAILAVELARLGLLNANQMFPTYSGAPYLGSEAAKRNTLLISRVASLGKLHHQSIGYTGPLSRQLLGYNSMISAVRSALRDLTEACLATLFLNGDADRNRDDFAALGLE